MADTRALTRLARALHRRLEPPITATILGVDRPLRLPLTIERRGA